MTRKIDHYPEVNPMNDKTDGRIIGWISGGVASAVACKLAIDHYGADRVSLVFCDTSWEHSDTYRFLSDLEKYFGKKIEMLKSHRMSNPEEVWRKYLGMNFANGAPCSTVLKREVRIKYQDERNDFAQVFGFDYDKKEMRRATNMLLNYPELNPIFPLVVEQYDRKKIFATLEEMGIQRPKAYDHFLNNNCIGDFDSPIGGCVQGGIGYWQKMKDLFPKKYAYMANIEHEISRDKGKPVTVCKDQRKGKVGNRLFLEACPDFPEVETISVIKGRQPVTPFECNGFCKTQDAQEAGTEIEQQCSKVVRELEAPKTLQASFISRTLKRVDEDRTVIEVEEQSE